ncbi:hypothetical protein KVR01_013561 [Diaporthe batatas]|uniref:uncharacterized protein n=1 Tax=Diaporthe batatas TaxID=748121 RepID=UPI001D0534A9|nr:uncharacterized protein KVR01_013561 [Diaporthe batatas]KAG8156610.1 hypothetical protein KVR01_013561 [Diaporthe batatas]
MSANTRPQLKFFLYSDPEEAKKPDNKRQVRIHVARNSHAKTRNARTKTTKTCQARGGNDCLQYQASGSTSGGQVACRNWALLPPMSSGLGSSPYPPGVMFFDTTLPTRSYPDLLAWVPSTGPAQGLLQELSLEEKFLLDHFVTVQVSQWRSKYEAVHPPFDLIAFRHNFVTKLVMLCITDFGLIQAILLLSSQVFANMHYSSGNEGQGKRFEQNSFQYRGRLLRNMAENMPHDPRYITDSIIAKGLFLTFNETLGLDGFLAQLYTWCSEEIDAAREDICFTTA